MSVVLRLPEILTGMESATLTAWHVDVGDEVRAGQPLADVETEKAVVEYTAEQAGTLARRLVDVDSAIEVGTPVVLLAVGDESVEDAVASYDGGSEPATVAPDTPPEPVAEGIPLVVPEPAPEPVAEGARLRATPIVHRLARERGVDLTRVRGSGPHGRIVRRDLDAHVAPPAVATPAGPPAAEPPVAEPRVASAPVVAAPVAAPAATDAAYTVVPHTGMRRAIARRLVESKQQVPHFYLTAHCRVDALVALRRTVNEATGGRLSLNDYVVKAAASALVAVPELNATWTEDAVHRHQDVDIAVAVALEDGLMTPIVSDVASRSVSSVGAAVRDLAERARGGRLRPAELGAGTFSVSNLGMYGVDEAAAIINPPHAGILAVGAVTEQPVVQDGALVVGSVMSVTLSADHRVVDGATGARWLAAFRQLVEEPLRILA